MIVSGSWKGLCCEDSAARLVAWEKTKTDNMRVSEVSGKERRIEDRRFMDEGGEWLTMERLYE